MLSSCGNLLGIISWKFQRNRCFITSSLPGAPLQGSPGGAPSGAPPVRGAPSLPPRDWGLGAGASASRLLGSAWFRLDFGLISAWLRLDFGFGFDSILYSIWISFDFDLIRVDSILNGFGLILIRFGLISVDSA